MKCEACGKREAVSFSYFGIRNAGQPNGAWMLTCNCTANRGDYYVMLDEFRQERGQWRTYHARRGWTGEIFGGYWTSSIRSNPYHPDSRGAPAKKLDWQTARQAEQAQDGGEESHRET